MSERRGFAVAERDLQTFDRQFQTRCKVQRPDRYRLLDALPRDAPRIARGGGVSYVAASFGEAVVSQEMAAFDRVLAFDAERGALTVEAGAAIGDVQRFALARGWYLAVSPGHPRASIGGCIAADVHGKNPARDGTFRAQVDALEICAADGTTRDADAGNNTELFAATFAGFGLTGTITRATLRLSRPPAALAVRRVAVADLAEAARVLREAGDAPVLYGWHDGRARRFGRGVIQIGVDQIGESALGGIQHAASRTQHKIPAAAGDLPASVKPLPITLWRHSGIAAANAWLAWRWRARGARPIALAAALFPLNGARGYFAGFGKDGMSEAQWLIPHARFDEFAGMLADLVARDSPRISLIASKLFAGHAAGFRFDGAGIALAIQVAAPAQTAQRRFLEALATLATAHGGRPNLIKESSIDATSARRAIGDFEAARARLAEHNPGALHGSELSRRLAL